MSLSFDRQYKDVEYGGGDLTINANYSTPGRKLIVVSVCIQADSGSLYANSVSDNADGGSHSFNALSINNSGGALGCNTRLFWRVTDSTDSTVTISLDCSGAGEATVGWWVGIYTVDAGEDVTVEANAAYTTSFGAPPFITGTLSGVSGTKDRLYLAHLGGGSEMMAPYSSHQIPTGNSSGVTARDCVYTGSSQTVWDRFTTTAINNYAQVSPSQIGAYCGELVCFASEVTATTTTSSTSTTTTTTTTTSSTSTASTVSSSSTTTGTTAPPLPGETAIFIGRKEQIKKVFDCGEIKKTFTRGEIKKTFTRGEVKRVFISEPNLQGGP